MSSDTGSAGAGAPRRITVAGAAAWPLIRSWAEAEHWSPGAADGTCYLAADPGSLHVGHVGAEAVSAVFTVNHSDAFSFLGLYLVVPERRGRGHGKATFEAGLVHAGSRTVALNAVVDQVSNYKRSGFSPAYRLRRFAGVPSPAVLGAPGSGLVSDGGLVSDPGTVGWAELAAFDARHFPSPRRRFVEAWLTAPGHTVRIAVDDRGVRGYGVVRPCTDHARIGPLIASDPQTAQALFADLVAAAPPGPVAFDVSDTNPRAARLASALGLTEQFEMVRMYTPGSVEEGDQAAVWAVASAEVG